jgi:hypothetical protein
VRWFGQQRSLFFLKVLLGTSLERATVSGHCSLVDLPLSPFYFFFGAVCLLLPQHFFPFGIAFGFIGCLLYLLYLNRGTPLGDFPAFS